MLPHSLPLWPKLAYTAFVCLLIPIYWVKYGPANFLWFSDISLFTTAVALWMESSLLASMMAVGVLLFELFWNFGFFARLIFGVNVTNLSAYMFDASRPLYLRLLSLFHVVLPPMLLWLVYRLGYDRRALLAQTLLAAVVLPLSYWATPAKENINWVLGMGSSPQMRFPPVVYLGMMMIAFPVIVYWPTHLVLARFFGKAVLH